MAPRSFRFLDLPKELRLVVYERMDSPRRHDKLWIPSCGENAYITLITRHSKPPISAIIFTCRLIDEEASMILKKYALQEAPSLDIPRFILPAAYATNLARHNGIIDEVLKYLRCVQSHISCRVPTADVVYKELEERNNTFDLGFMDSYDLAAALSNFAVAGVNTSHSDSQPRLWRHCGRVEILLEGVGQGPQMEIFLARLAEKVQDHRTAISVFRTWGGNGRLGRRLKTGSGLKDKGRLREEDWIKHWF